MEVNTPTVVTSLDHVALEPHKELFSSEELKQQVLNELNILEPNKTMAVYAVADYTQANGFGARLGVARKLDDTWTLGGQLGYTTNVGFGGNVVIKGSW